MSKSIDEQIDEILSEIEIEYWPEEGDMSLDSRSVSSATQAIKALINQAVREAINAKDEAYWERNQLVAVLSRLYPSHLAKHPEADTEWEDDWRNIVCVHTPAGQATWHIHDTDLDNFYHLRQEAEHWDGHTTAEKYNRLAELKEEQ